jgi:hypothetical protein
MEDLSCHCPNCDATIEDGARYLAKCAYCCKQYCNKCISSDATCPHCGRSGTDWRRRMVTYEEWLLRM